jgi:enoyl-[acyl-carrier protein] reductase II
MIQTKLTKLLGIKHPIVLAGANWLTYPELVAEVSNAGGLGILAVAQYTPDQTRENVKKIKSLTKKPFGINQILVGPGAKENIQIAIEEKVPIINYSLGKPWFVDEVHKYGGKVVGTIALSRHAVKAQELGCDALIITGHEAAAHGADATSLVLIPIVARLVKIPLIAAGGFYDGRGLAGAIALGADAISMGTRFMLTKESRLHDKFKELCLKASEADTLYSSYFDGMDGRVLKTKQASKMMKGSLSLPEAFGAASIVKNMLNLSTWQFMQMGLAMMFAGEDSKGVKILARQAIGAKRHLLAIEKGDVDEGILFAGKCVGGINFIPTIKDVMTTIVKEAEATMRGSVKMIKSA